MTRSHPFPAGTRRIAIPALAIGTAGIVTAALLSGGAADAAPSGTSAVPQGIGTLALDGATAQSATASDTKVRVSFVLRARHLNQLQRRVTHVWHGRHLTPASFARQYGQSPSVIRGLRHYLGDYGISTSVIRGGLDVTAVGTAAQFNKALRISLRNYRVTQQVPGRPGHHRSVTVHGTKKNPRLPRHIARSILSILGLSNYGPFVSSSVHALPHTKGATPQASGTLPPGSHTPGDFVKRYHLGSVERAGHTGQRQQIGIVTLASLDPSTPKTFWHKYLGMNHIRDDKIVLNDVDGGAGPVSLDTGSDETSLDVEQSGAIAPSSQVVVYAAPNTDAGFADAFFTAAGQNRAGSVSASWGESETIIKAMIGQAKMSPNYVAAYDEAFLQLAAQGQATFTSSGDEGAYTASNPADMNTTNIVVDNPSDSPYQTSAGGTTLPGTQSYGPSSAGVAGSVDIKHERAWGIGYLWPLHDIWGFDSTAAAATNRDPSKPEFNSGGGGGYSGFEPRPAYQKDVSRYQYRQYLTPSDYQTVQGLKLPTGFSFTEHPALRRGVQRHGRAVPDVSTNADPQTGYAVYMPQFKDVYGSAVEQYGGTSFVAPQLAGASAVLNSAVGHRIGFWNPRIYRMARGHRSPFKRLNSTRVHGPSAYTETKNGQQVKVDGQYTNDNLYYTGNPGSYYNPATGLGVPNFADLAHAFRR